MTDAPARRRGFNTISPERLLEIARLGGSSVPARKRSFSVNRALAISAGRKGGQVRTPRSTPHAPD